ncbi:MAG: cyclic nucleotide-binding domain-containing protein [Acidimicrobiales bacterium]
MTRRNIVVTVVKLADCEPCAMAVELADDLVHQNTPLGIEQVVIDVDADPRAVREVRATSHPTVLLTIDGVERASLTGTISKRRLLQKFLPVLYAEEAQALAQLRRQLGSPSEHFHRRPVRDRVRQAEKVRLLQSVPLFAGLKRRDLAQLARLVDEIHRHSGAEVTVQGEPGDEFFVVVEGGVDVFRDQKRVNRLVPGDWFGEMSLLADQPRSATVRTTAETTLLTIHRTDFDRLLSSNPPVMRALLTTLADRMV